MTSMPASRSARAMILAPRSWPSRPGLAISTRILCCGMRSKSSFPLSGDGYFLVGAEDLAEGFADFAQGGVGLYGCVDGRHQVFFALGRLAQGGQGAGDCFLGGLGAQFVEPGGLAVRNGFVYLQDVQWLFLGDEIVHAYH